VVYESCVVEAGSRYQIFLRGYLGKFCGTVSKNSPSLFLCNVILSRQNHCEMRRGGKTRHATKQFPSSNEITSSTTRNDSLCHGIAWIVAVAFIPFERCVGTGLPVLIARPGHMCLQLVGTRFFTSFENGGF